MGTTLRPTYFNAGRSLTIEIPILIKFKRKHVYFGLKYVMHRICKSSNPHYRKYPHSQLLIGTKSMNVPPSDEIYKYLWETATKETVLARTWNKTKFKKIWKIGILSLNCYFLSITKVKATFPLRAGK